jgi:hypothetical protein
MADMESMKAIGERDSRLKEIPRGRVVPEFQTKIHSLKNLKQKMLVSGQTQNTFWVCLHKVATRFLSKNMNNSHNRHLLFCFIFCYLSIIFFPPHIYFKKKTPQGNEATNLCLCLPFFCCFFLGEFTIAFSAELRDSRGLHRTKKKFQRFLLHFSTKKLTVSVFKTHQKTAGTFFPIWH